MSFKIADNLTVLSSSEIDAGYVNVTGDTMTGALVIDAGSDAIQLRVQGHSTQTNQLATWEKSDASVVGQMLNRGGFGVGEGHTVADRCIALGENAVSNNVLGVAIGFSADALNASSVAVGSNTSSSGDSSVAVGFSTTASNQSAVAVGLYNVASGGASYAGGRAARATAECGTMGYFHEDVGGSNGTATTLMIGVGSNAATRRSIFLSLSETTFNEDSDDVDLRIEGNGDANLFFVDAGNDRIGVGTNAPGALLDVRGAAIFNEAGADADFRIEGDTDANLFFVDASTDRIGVGTNAPADKFEVNTASSNGVRVMYTGASGVSAGPVISMYTNDGAAMESAERIGSIQFGGHNGSSIVNGALILAKASETWSGTARGCRIEMYTVPNTTTGQTLALTIQNDAEADFTGNVDVASGKVYKVNGTQVVSARDTGYAAMTGTPNEGTTYDTATVTLAQLAGRVMALQASLTTHGLIGA